MFGRRERAAHLGKSRHHVAALFLEQTHVGTYTAHHILHMTALLAKVTDKQPLFFKHDLEFLELALLLAQAIARKLERSIGLTRGRFHIAPGSLKAAQLIDSKNLRKLVGPIGKVAILSCPINLTLERAQLARNLAIDITSALEMLVHRSDLLERALLASLVLGNASGLFDQRAALLGTAL